MHYLYSKWFEPRSISSSYCVIVRVRVLFITAVNVSSYHGLNKNKSLFDDKILTEDPNKALPEIFSNHQAWLCTKVYETYPRQSALNRWKLTEGRIFQRPSRWKMCWTNHLALYSKYRSYGRLLKCRARGSTAPSKRCRSEPRLGQYAEIYTHAERETKQQINLRQLQLLNLEEIL